MSEPTVAPQDDALRGSLRGSSVAPQDDASVAPQDSAFDVVGDLPGPGDTVLLEASAGTGKTWTIGALVARYVAEGLPLESLLVITFGRAASQEMRERVREHLRLVHRGLVDPQTADGDPVVALLRSGAPDEVALRERRLREALTHFDGATIATTHQFCQLVLRGLGVAGDTDPRARLVEDLTDLRDEVVDDLYLRGFAASEGPPAFSREEAGAIARVVVEHPHSTISPHELPGATVAARKLRFAHLVRDEMTRRKRRLGVLSFDDLLSELADALADDTSPARQRMRDRWQVVLVDEFQDTDPVQWQVLERAFAGHSALVLIGDPKQAIYGFRGGDVHTYLAAAATATRRHTLVRNHRSDPALVGALTTMMRGARLGSPEIVVHPVEPAKGESRLALPGADEDPLLSPVRLRAVPTALVAGDDGKVSIGSVRPVVARDCAAEVARLLASGMTFEGRPLRAGDIAVLAHKRDSLEQVRGALHDIGIASVVVSSESIFATPAADDWLTLLEAMAQSHRADRVRAAALTTFVGHRAADLDAGGDDLVDEVARVLRTWSEVLGRRGVAAVLAAATTGGLESRALGLEGGERRLTDLRHLGEVLHERAVVEGGGLAALTTWLRERMQAVRQEERTRRLDSDADAVALATIHASKGLQYPVVLLPFVADRFVTRANRLTHLRFHDDEGRRCLDIGITEDPDRGERVTRHQDEEDGEALRMLYVALTRAQSQVVTWWFPSGMNTPPSALHRMLFGREPGQGQLPPRVAVPSDVEAAGRLRAWEREGAFALEVVDEAVVQRADPEAVRRELTARTWSRVVDDGWMRTSYTRLTRPLESGTVGVPTPSAPDDLVGSEPEHGPREGEDEVGPLARPGDGDDGGVSSTRAVLPSPMADLPVGATFGNLVHAVLEEADPQAPDLRAELLAHVEHQAGRWPVAGLERLALAEALELVCETPLGPLLPGATLRSVGRDRLCEMDFELPLASGDAAHAGDGVLLGELSRLLRHHLPEGDPVRGLAETLDDPAVGDQPLRGYLTGSVDVVLRHEGRYVVVDYKTNWLGAVDEPLTTDHYGPMALHEAMGHSSYPLQALLYAVVLHRFLRWRLPGYDPTTHLGGVLYLYVRGMAGPSTPVVGGHPTGVFSWLPPVALVEAVSELLDGRAP
ncbi:UvrD-helicase domain-containing protein [Janibacter melonis]|uniref:UvrD-helicase domain-containing protein n=1 Tax=Janibacter melonis TaxID=262209 RepID=UPI001786B4E2|nr:exodeoxyribonuclease V subunit beta [Janibacter melonis]